MVVGTLRITLSLDGAQSLKEKRRIVQSLVQRLHHTFPVSVSEVDDHEMWTRATLGVACVSNDGRHADRVLAQVVRYLEREREAYVVDYEVEIR
jgi:uncharacterized protein YlxP (DUF503 family)